MEEMSWSRLLSAKRTGMENLEERKHDRTLFQRDYDRLIFSSPFRRLQNKTQVFPLPGSIFVHNRLTHSLEVSSVGRSLGSNVGRALMAQHPDDDAPLGEIHSIVAAACLAHDLGNPPFGHSGEAAISEFFRNGAGVALEDTVRAEGGRWEDFTFFEGNANAMRLLTHQFRGRRQGGFAMTYSMLSSVVKYPYASTLCETKSKFGFFQSEEDTYAHIADALGLIRHKGEAHSYVRHPLVYLVEAADDICYQVMDIEDAHKLRILSHDETIELLLAFFDARRRLSVERVLALVTDRNERIAYLRSCAIGLMVDHCTKAFLNHLPAMLRGEHVAPLISLMEEMSAEAYRQCSKVAIDRIYQSREVLDIELVGYRIIAELMENFVDAVLSPKGKYAKLLLRRVGEQYDTQAPTTYGKVQSILDYLSGMTDVFVLDLYKKITGQNIPVL